MRDSYRSELTHEEVKVGMKFDFLERKWEVTMVNRSNFRAKTTDNSPTKGQKVADFIYKKGDRE